VRTDDDLDTCCVRERTDLVVDGTEPLLLWDASDKVAILSKSLNCRCFEFAEFVRLSITFWENFRLVSNLGSLQTSNHLKITVCVSCFTWCTTLLASLAILVYLHRP
jgi:hypothetical protein